MTDNDIIKALEWCSKEDYCNTSVCPIYRDMGDDEACATKISEVALDLINRQKAEIERLTEDNEEFGKIIGQAAALNCFLEASRKCVGNEAIKEFAERFGALLADFDDYDTLHIYEIKDRLDLVKEMTEGKE